MLNPNLHMALAQAHQEDLRRAAEAAHRADGLPRRKRFTRFGTGPVAWIDRISPTLRGSTPVVDDIANR